MINNHSKIEFTDALFIGYVSVITYLLTASKELAFIKYYRIPKYYLHLNIFESSSDFLIIFTTLIVSYVILNDVFHYFDTLRYKIVPNSNSIILRIIVIILTDIIPAILISIILYSTTKNQDDFVLYTTITFLVYLCTSYINLKLTLNNPNNRILFNNISLNIKWLIFMYIIFWCYGFYEAKNNTKFLTIDNGKTVIIYISENKLFTKNIVNGKLINDESFSIYNLEDSISCKSIIVNR